MTDLFLATTNPRKVADFARLGLDIPFQQAADGREADGTIHDIVIEKARRESTGAVVEDTCLYVDGFPEVGNRIKYEEHRIPSMIGKRALWVCGIAVRLESRINIYVGRVPGIIVQPEGAFSPGPLSDPQDFVNFFRPDGAFQTYSEMLQNDLGGKDTISAYYSARGRALRKYFADDFEFSVPPRGHWRGLWQDETPTKPQEGNVGA